MSKRKREIQKRKRNADETGEDEGHRAAVSASDVEAGVKPGREAAPGEGTGAAGPPEKGSETAIPRSAAGSKRKPDRRKTSADPGPAADSARGSWLAGNRGNLLLGLLVVYVLLLGLGTVGELFEIEWILNLPLFK